MEGRTVLKCELEIPEVSGRLAKWPEDQKLNIYSTFFITRFIKSKIYRRLLRNGMLTQMRRKSHMILAGSEQTGFYTADLAQTKVDQCLSAP